MKVIDINRDEGSSNKGAHEKSLHTLKRTGGGAALRMQVAAVFCCRDGHRTNVRFVRFEYSIEHESNRIEQHTRSIRVESNRDPRFESYRIERPFVRFVRFVRFPGGFYHFLGLVVGDRVPNALNPTVICS